MYLDVCEPWFLTSIHMLGCRYLMMGIGKILVSCSSLNLSLLYWTGWMEDVRESSICCKLFSLILNGTDHHCIPAITVSPSSYRSFRHPPLLYMVYTVYISGGRCCLRLGRTICNFFMSMDIFLLQNIGWLSVIHIPIHPGQCNIDRSRLLHDTQICSIPIMRLLQPSLQMKVYNVGAQVERQIEVIKVTDSDTFSTALHTLACV